MRKRKLTKHELDAITAGLLRGDELRRDETDDIASKPHLFDAVMARIEIQERRAEKTAFSLRSSIAGALLRPLPAFAAAVLTVAAISLVFFMKQPGNPEQAKSAPETRDSHVSKTADVVTSVNEFKQQQPVAAKEPSEPAAAQTVSLRRKQAVKPRTVHHGADKDEMGEFYALAYSGDRDRDEDGSQIIRVELPRSALYAMGVNVPVENEAVRIKTDLLVGPDGVMRAVRFVK